MDRRQVVLREDVIEHLLAASGGHSGLLRAAFELAHSKPANKRISALRGMLADYSVESECRKIWDSLTDRELEVLLCLATGQRWAGSDDDIAKHLKVKGLLVAGEAGETIFFSPVFAQFVRRESRS